MLQQRAVRKESPLQLLVPALAQLDTYADALRRGWSPDNVRLVEAAREELELIAEDRAAFVAMLDDREAKARAHHPARWLAGATPAGLPALDVG